MDAKELAEQLDGSEYPFDPTDERIKEMTDYKYLKDGRKVAVIGTLNNTETIVQEIFVAENGDEFPAGENFVARGLLDKPAQTFADRREIERSVALANVEEKITKACAKLHEVESRAHITSLYHHILDVYEDKTPEDIQALLAFMSGEITHVVFERWGAPEIVEILDALAKTDENRFTGLKLVSLFGVRREQPMRRDDNSQLGLEWRISEYHDGSGISTTIHPCRGLEEAVRVVDRILAEKDVSQKTIDMKAEYGLANPTDERIQAWRRKISDATKKEIRKLQDRIAELQAAQE